ncbi:aldehyde dehydrogenase family protein [Saccharopolyspora cebuensis]|uniref:Aldehyde dehydrogenase family protein n=1 Tax=Saccharopolyspora cebuensis TaxID=418759 RepID=A0ABV4CAC4_9PSEU
MSAPGLLAPGAPPLDRAAAGRRAVGVADALRARGVRPADRVMVLGDNSADYVIVLLGLMHLGASIVLLDHRQTAAEVRRAAALADVRWLVADSPGAPGEPLRRLGLGELAGSAPSSAGQVSLRAWRDRADALITWSSGTEGPAKGIVRSGGSFVDNIDRSRRRMRYRTDDALLPLLPFSHQYGLSVVLLWWRVGCSLLVAPYHRVDHALEFAARGGATAVDAAPMTYHTALNLMRNRPALLEALRSVRMWCVGGSPLGAALAERFRRVTGRPLLDGYGSTETGNIALAAPDDPVGCGRPLDGVHVTVLDEAGAPVPPGVLGEVVLSSPDLTSGYLEPGGGVRPLPEGPYRTRDLGHLDEAGHLFVVGRAAAVHRMGHVLYPEVLATKAAECGAPVRVVPVEDERRGCHLVFVVADPQLREPRFWRSRIDALLPSYERPNRVVVVEEIPLNSNGKPDTGALDRLVRRSTGHRSVGEQLPAVPFPQRIGALRAVADFLRDHRAEVLDLLCEISPRKAVETELASSLEALTGACEEMETYRPGRVGRMAVFMPSNVLCYSYVLYLLIPALYTERLVFRPSAQVASLTRRLHAMLAPVHGLPLEPSGLSQRRFVEGPVPESDVVVFTGTYQNVEQIRTQLRPEQLLLFFGQGVNPFVVTEGADLDIAVADAIRIRMLNGGQDCFGPDVFLVPEDAADRFVELLVKEIGELRYGDYRDEDADYGPLYYDSALQRVTDYLRKHREHIVFGGRLDLRERHLHPTVLLRPYSERITLEEMFSPVFNIVVYQNDQQLRSVLRMPFIDDRAMAAMVYGEHPELVEMLSRRHQVCVNRTVLDEENGNRPFGGHGMVANFAAYRGKRVAEPLLISKAVAQHMTTAAPEADDRAGGC